MNKLIRGVATVATSLSLIGGFASIAGASSGGNTTSGPDSHSSVKISMYFKTSVKNNNTLSAMNSNNQSATTGKVKVDKNTTAGDATSGDATLTNTTSVSATVDNSASSTALAVDPSTLSGGDNGGNTTSGPGAKSDVSSTVKVSTNLQNNNMLTVSNENSQSAATGNVEVSGNTSGGSATSGSATESNVTAVTFDVTN
jgi:hypothetical protein